MRKNFKQKFLNHIIANGHTDNCNMNLFVNFIDGLLVSPTVCQSLRWLGGAVHENGGRE